jgi:diguanylate cyclase (GGDEF)-like protein
VLLVDDDADVRSLVRSLCEQAGVELDEAPDAASGLAAAERRKPDLILLDLVLPDGDGVDIARELRANERLASVPIVVLSARHSQESKVRAFDAGADDYVVKPFGLAEIDARIRANLRKRELYEKLEKNNLELQLLNERLEELATTDPLTGLVNVRTLRDRLREELLRAERYETTLSVVMVDLDGFKAVNDAQGHSAGDKLLAQLAQRLRAQARATDVVARYGGDEFAFMLPHTTLEEALRFAERLCDRISKAPLRLQDGRPADVGLSCGVASWPECERIETEEDLLKRADEALYRVKRSGGCGVLAAPVRHSPAERGSTASRRSPDSRSPRENGGA